MFKIIALTLFMSSIGATAARAETTLKVAGPGGPAPAMKACASAFEKNTKIKIDIVAGPTDTWADKAGSVDVFYSGSENMMDGFAEKFKNLDSSSIETHYLRPSAILVRKNNPKKIAGIKDLVEKDVKVIVVNGAGQVGMWEDILGRLKSVEAINKFRKKIAYAAPNTGLADKRWKEDSSIDAWLVFNIWGTRNPDNALIVPTEQDLTIYRSSGTALSKNSKHTQEARSFIEFVKGSECRKFFEKEGWF